MNTGAAGVVDVARMRHRAPMYLGIAPSHQFWSLVWARWDV